MQFSKFLVAAAAFALAQAVEFTDPTFSTITAGKPFNVTWTGADGPVTLTLKNGPSTALNTVSVIQSGLTGTFYTWNVPSTLTADTYALEITDSSGTPNYSTLFQLIGGVASTSSAAPSTSSGSSSSTGSSSSASVTSLSSSGNSTTVASGSSSKTTSAGSKTTSSGSSSTGSKTSSATGSSSSTSAPSSASGLSSPLALVFLALAAILTLN